MYDELDEYAERCIRDKSWNVLLSRIKQVRDKGATIDTSRKEVVPLGRVRDALTHILGLEATYGIDTDMMETFKDLKPNSLKNLRSLVIPIAIENLQEQIRNNNTFFMDIEKMATTAFAILVQDIVQSRNAEVLSIGSNPSVEQVLSSYYGYSILTLGTSVQRQYRWEAPEAVEAIKELAKSLGTTVQFIQMKPKISPQKVFHNCSEQTATLLADIATHGLHNSDEVFI
jgi:hypothetical protein